jgi:signal peptidase
VNQANKAAPLPAFDGRARLVRATIGATLLEAAALLLLLVAWATVPVFMGDRTLTVMSGSMEPTIPTGAAVVIEPLPSRDLKPGDVIAFTSGPESAATIVHRIVSTREARGILYYTTRGDGNKSVDTTEISLPATAWRVWYSVPFAGYLIYFAGSRLGAVTLIAIPCITLLALYAADWLRRKKRQGYTLAYS